MKAFYIIKSLGTFGITLYYLTLSYVRPAKLTTLKKQWALSVMNYLGYSVSAEGDYKIDGPKIYVGNHVSYLDILLLMATNPHIAFKAGLFLELLRLVLVHFTLIANLNMIAKIFESKSVTSS
jgi:1-acyl-sn-glycerol-3-phosphate acyltransferase